jgi:hypothetical protein
MLTGREKTDVADADVTMNWMLYATVKVLMVKRER